MDGYTKHALGITEKQTPSRTEIWAMRIFFIRGGILFWGLMIAICVQSFTG